MPSRRPRVVWRRAGTALLTVVAFGKYCQRIDGTVFPPSTACGLTAVITALPLVQRFGDAASPAPAGGIIMILLLLLQEDTRPGPPPRIRQKLVAVLAIAQLAGNHDDSALVRHGHRHRQAGCSRAGGGGAASLIDIRDPLQPTARLPSSCATPRRLIGEIQARGRRLPSWSAAPCCTGCHFPCWTPCRPHTLALRAFDAEARERGWPALHVRSWRQVDPPTAQRLAPNDLQRSSARWRSGATKPISPLVTHTPQTLLTLDSAHAAPVRVGSL